MEVASLFTNGNSIINNTTLVHEENKTPKVTQGNVTSVINEIMLQRHLINTS